MKKVINITIGNVVFSIEEDAYQKLSTYLEEIKQHFKSSPDADEIINDIEIGIAEKFTARSQDKHSTINQADVTAIITAMGTVAEFAKFEEPESHTDQKRQPGHQAEQTNQRTQLKQKRLYRNPDDQIIAGVASGIAAYFDIDPVIPRLLFAASVFFGGFGIIAYILLWLILPDAKTAPQKLQMRGHAVTLSKISAAVEEGIESVADRNPGLVKNIVSIPVTLINFVFTIIKKIAQFFIPFLRIVVGSFLVLAPAFVIIMLAIALVALLIGSSTPSADPATQVVIESLQATPVWLTILIIALYLFIVIPLSAIILGGLSLLRKKNSFTPTIAATFVVAWLVTVASLFSFGAIKAPHIAGSVQEVVRTEVNTEPITKEYADLATFNKINISGGSVTLVAKTGDTQSVSVTARQRRHDNLRVDVKNNTLHVESRNLFNICFFNCHDYDAIEVAITSPDLERIALSGSSQGSIQNLTGDELTLSLSGSSRIAANTNVGTLNIHASGSSRVKLLGNADTVDLDLSGSSRIYGYELTANRVTIKSSGSSRITTHTQDALHINTSGSSTVHYIGNDTNVTERTSGSSRIENIPADQADIDHSLDHLLDKIR